MNKVPKLVSTETEIIDRTSAEYKELMQLYYIHNRDEVDNIEEEMKSLQSQFVSGVKSTFKFDNDMVKEVIGLNFLADTFTDETRTEPSMHYEMFTLTGTQENDEYMLHSQFATCSLCLHEHDHEHSFDINPN